MLTSGCFLETEMKEMEKLPILFSLYVFILKSDKC